MGNAAKKDMEQYAPEKIWDRWEMLMGEFLKRAVDHEENSTK